LRAALRPPDRGFIVLPRDVGGRARGVAVAVATAARGRFVHTAARRWGRWALAPLIQRQDQVCNSAPLAMTWRLAIRGRVVCWLIEFAAFYVCWNAWDWLWASIR
jgi:hypothetical protein